jgi:hypothetical protein
MVNLVKPLFCCWCIVPVDPDAEGGVKVIIDSLDNAALVLGVHEVELHHLGVEYYKVCHGSPWKHLES